MRELKFRVWNGYLTKEYKAYDRCYTSMDGPYLEIKPYRYDNDCAIEQYTGLKDKNGKEIYEGDIVKLWDREPELVVWDNLIGVYDPLSWETFDTDECEVIGNIHENPELLESEE